MAVSTPHAVIYYSSVPVSAAVAGTCSPPHPSVAVAALVGMPQSIVLGAYPFPKDLPNLTLPMSAARAGGVQLSEPADHQPTIMI